MRLLIGYDGSTAAQAAIADLSRAGLPPRCEATVMSVADVWLPEEEPSTLPADGPYVRASASLRARAEQALRAAHALAVSGRDLLVARFPDWTVHAEASADSPAWAIIRLAEQIHADMVVVGSHGRGSLGRVIFGSVSTRILDELRRTVRVARAPRSGGPLRILVGVDGSPDSDAAVRAVAGRSWPPATEVRVVIAANWRLLTEPLMPTTGPDVPLEAWAEVIARRSVDHLTQAGLHATLSVKAGDAKRVLLTEAESWEADCVFVGARGMTRGERWILGGVSTAVAMRAPCSVEVVHAA